MIKQISALLFGILVTTLPCLHAQNPLITDQFTADPTARVFDGRMYVYPSHDIPCGENQGFIGFCMEDYHVFSSENLTDWVDHGVVLTQENVPWAEQTSYSMWAPDCIFKDGTYYFYYPVIAKGKLKERGRTIGVATSDKPYGPFIPEENSIVGISGLDPNAFIDKDGQAYLYWANGHDLFVAKLSDDMKQITTEPLLIANLPEGFKEGPFTFERNGIYYFTFPHVKNKTEELAYATGDNPMGPFTYRGVIMEESPVACWTNHQSMVEYQGQWYLFYHHNDLSPDFDKNRSIKADSLFFNDDGTIVKVTPTLRGIGINDATKEIQIDRYSDCSAAGIDISFIDESDKMEGWKATFTEKGSWIRYNSVNFDNLKSNTIHIKGVSEKGSSITIRLDKIDGPIIAQIKIPKSENWSVIQADLKETPTGLHHLFIVSDANTGVDIDWIQFE